ncbi:MAG: hypothetical protein NTV34_02085, partial [Proteobacteria bacterium]|nr:hypothetical protein [Pseudomonadota bacterium]
MTRRYRHCFVVGLLIFLCGQWCFGAVISATSPSTLSLTRGDRIELEISAPSANIIEWYLEGKKIKKGSRVEILTGDLGPGDYKIYALALLGNALEVALFRMSLEPSPILYKPKVIKPGLVTTGSVSTLPPNQWWVTSLRGHLTEDTGTGRKLDSSRSLPDFLTIEKSAGIRQGAGTDSVWTWVDRQEMLFFRVPALLKRRSRELQLDSGRFVWRRLTPNPLAAEAYNSKSGSIEVGQDVKIASSGLGDLFFEVKSVDGKFVVDLFSVGTDFSLQCGQNLVIVSRDDFGRRVTFDKTKDGCKFLNTKELDLRASIMGWAKDFFPQWFEEPIGALEHLVRLDMRQPEEVNDVTLLTTQTMKMIQERRWASVLDALVPIFENGLQTSDLLIGRGTAWQALDFKGLAEKDFKAALEESTQNYRAAKSLGDLRSLAGDHSKALYWYFTALGWGHPDKPELYRLMSGESVKLGAMRNAVAFVEEAYWYEESEETAGVDFNRRINLDDQRSSRGVVTTGLGVRSHVLPIERAEFGDLTNQATTNRGLIMEAEGEWQKQLTKDSSAEVRLDGNHMIKYPANALLSTGSMSDHLIGIRMKSARRLVQMGGSFHLGTRLRGGERQTDEFRPGL